jgi:hypothetical protein
LSDLGRRDLIEDSGQAPNNIPDPAKHVVAIGERSHIGDWDPNPTKLRIQLKYVVLIGKHLMLGIWIRIDREFGFGFEQKFRILGSFRIRVQFRKIY